MSDTSNASSEGAQDTGNTGSEQASTNTSSETTSQSFEETETGRAGGDDSLKADLAKERRARQAEAKKASDLQARLDKFEEATKSETEKLIDRARKDGESEATKRANLKIAKMAVRAAAQDKLADPSDADVLDVSKFEVDDDGNVDMKSINSELDRLLKDKPHWAKAEKRTGSADQGARGSAAKPTDMNSFLRQAMGHK